MLVLFNQDGTKQANDGANISSKEDEHEEEEEDRIGQQDDNWATLLTCLWGSWDLDQGGAGVAENGMAFSIKRVFLLIDPSEVEMAEEVECGVSERSVVDAFLLSPP